jgi:hypothetical protein
MTTLTLATATREQIEEMQRFRRTLLSYAREVRFATSYGWETEIRPAPREAYFSDEELFEWLVSRGRFR